MSVTIWLRELAEKPKPPGVYTDIEDPRVTTAPVEHPAPLVQAGISARRVHLPPPGRYEPVPANPPQIVTATPINLFSDVPLEIQLEALGDGPFDWSVDALPQGLSLAADGSLRGMVVPNPYIITAAEITIYKSTQIVFYLSAIYGVKPYTFSADALPAGLVLAADGEISGMVT